MAGTDTGDTELVEKSLLGNREALGRIVARYQSLICPLAYSAASCLGQSEDLAREAFVTAWKRLRDLREPAKLRSWLRGIARNCTNNALRREGRRPLAEQHPPDQDTEVVVSVHIPTQNPQTNEEPSKSRKST